MKKLFELLKTYRASMVIIPSTYEDLNSSSNTFSIRLQMGNGVERRFQESKLSFEFVEHIDEDLQLKLLTEWLVKMDGLLYPEKYLPG